MSFDCKTSYRMRLPFSWGELSEGNLTNRTNLTLLTTVVVEGHDDVKKNPSHELLPLRARDFHRAESAASFGKHGNDLAFFFVSVVAGWRSGRRKPSWSLLIVL